MNRIHNDEGLPSRISSPRDTPQTMNQRGEWVPAIPLPGFYHLRHHCTCGQKFWRMVNYRAHYAYVHIILGEEDL